MTQQPVDWIVEYVSRLKEKKGTALPVPLPKGIQAASFSDVKVVTKPWGFELWLAHGQTLPYALKMIYIKKGTKTSLQYHKEKQEHNVLFAGRARLHYENAETGEIVCQEVAEGSVIEIRPPSIHRFEALTDIFLIEASSHHLEDVVRLADDYHRPDGKIETEHKPTL